MTRPLAVAHAVQSLDCGGLERVVVNLVRGGQRLGQRVAVVCVDRLGTLADEVTALGATLACVEKRPGVDFGTARRLEQVLGELRPDVLHTHQIGALFYAGRSANRLGIPLVVHTEHGNHFRQSATGWFTKVRRRWLWRRAGRRAARFFCVSEEIAGEMVAQRVVPRSKVQVVANGIDTARFRGEGDAEAVRRSLGIPAGAPVVGTIGRLHEVKCQDLLLRAVAALRERSPAVQVLLVGDGPMRSSLEQLASSLDLRHAVHFTGYQAQPERYLQIMDVFALTSRSEGMPLAVLEAWAAGVPVVASAVGALPKLLEPGRTGFLFEPGDEATLAARLAELLVNRAEARALGEAGRAEVVRRFDLTQMAGTYEQHYRELLP